MPKLRKTPQQMREDALLKAVARCKIENGFAYDKDVADRMGLNKTSYSLYKKKGFQTMDLSLFAKMARMLGFTGSEVCAIIGVPYTEK